MLKPYTRLVSFFKCFFYEDVTTKESGPADVLLLASLSLFLKPSILFTL